MNLTVDTQVASEGDDAPDPEPIRSWVATVLNHPALRQHPRAEKLYATEDVEVSLRIVDETESQTLNRQFRGKDKPTNVLSFPAGSPESLPFLHLGDIVICAPVVAREAREQQKNLEAHTVHMVVHGLLHLLGFDHIEDDEADIMEGLEITLLAALNIANPYQSPLASTAS